MSDIDEPIMTDAECAEAYRDLRGRCAGMGYPRVGYALIDLAKLLHGIAAGVPVDFDELMARPEVDQAKAYRNLREVAADMGYSCIGYALDDLERLQREAA